MLKYFMEIIDKNPVLILLIVYATVIIYKVLCLFIPLDSHVDFFIAYVCTIIGAAVTVAGLGWTYIYEKDKDKIIAERNKIPNIIISAKPKKVRNGMLESLDISVISDGPGTALNVFIKYIDINDHTKYKRLYAGSLTAKNSKTFEIKCDNYIFESTVSLYFSDIENKKYYKKVLISTVVEKDPQPLNENTELYIHHSRAYPLGLTTGESEIVFMLDCENVLTPGDCGYIFCDLTNLFNEYSIPMKITKVKGTEITCKVYGDFSKNILFDMIKESCGLDVCNYEVTSGDAELF